MSPGTAGTPAEHAGQDAGQDAGGYAGSAGDVAVDDGTIDVMIAQYGDRVRQLPPVALVIAAYNEEGAVGPVVQNLPAQVCGLDTATIVVADGCAGRFCTTGPTAPSSL